MTSDSATGQMSSNGHLSIISADHPLDDDHATLDVLLATDPPAGHVHVWRARYEATTLVGDTPHIAVILRIHPPPGVKLPPGSPPLQTRVRMITQATVAESSLDDALEVACFLGVRDASLLFARQRGMEQRIEEANGWVQSPVRPVRPVIH